MINKRTGHGLVLGCGTSGLAAVRLMLRHGWRVTVIDEAADIEDRLCAGGIRPSRVEWGSDVSGFSSSDTDAAIVSPGIPRDHAWLKALRQQGIAVVPEFEFGLEHLRDTQVIGVTGSNGKSSLVKWIAEALTADGRRAVAAGNYGLPPSEVACSDEQPDYLVLELSSFQLEQSVSFRPDVGIFLNLSPNHLDRHATYEEYRSAKARLFAFAHAGDPALVHVDAYEEVRGELGSCRVDVFGVGQDVANHVAEGRVTLRSGIQVDLSGTWWGHLPQAVNAVAGVAVLNMLGLDAAGIRASAERFTPLPHRFEAFAEHKGIVFVDDSKASTLSAMQAAVSAGTAKKHLIAGGILKESDTSFVKEILVDYCAFVYCIGRVGEQLAQAWKDIVPCEVCGDLETAVTHSISRAKPGEMVLLSPGCSSFDQFSSYAQRGEKFKELVRERIGRNHGDETIMQGVRI